MLRGYGGVGEGGRSLRNQYQGAALEKEGRWASRSREACGFYGRKPRGQFWGPKVGHFHEHTVTSWSRIYAEARREMGLL